MTTEAEQAGDPARRKFDDVASLFGAIVPAPGGPVAPVRLRPDLRPVPALLPDPSAAPIVPPAPAEPEPVIDGPSAPPAILPTPSAVSAGALPPKQALTPSSLAPSHLAPSQLAPSHLAPELPIGRAPAPVRPAPKEIPWPDAFEPMPNYRKPEPRHYSWLLLIPLGLAVAYLVTTVDTRGVRNWVDTNVLHRNTAVSGVDTLLPGPFRRNWETPGPVKGFSPGADDTNITPALPTSPVAVPAGTEVSPPPQQPVPPGTSVPTSPVHVTINYRRGIPGAEGEARRLAALLQSTGGSVELRPASATAATPTIGYYDPADKGAATALATSLSNEASHWTLVKGAAKNPAGTIDVWMP